MCYVGLDLNFKFPKKEAKSDLKNKNSYPVLISQLTVQRAPKDRPMHSKKDTTSEIFSQLTRQESLQRAKVNDICLITVPGSEFQYKN